MLITEIEFKKFSDKIIHLVIDDMPTDGDAWKREQFQRHALTRGLCDAGPDDVVIIADADEFLRASTIDYLRANDGYFLFTTKMYQFFINTQASAVWNKVFAFSCELKDSIPDFSHVRVKQVETFEKFSGKNHRLSEAGWHFTYLGGADKVREKLAAYSHTGGVYEEMRGQGAVEQQLVTGHVVGGYNFTVFCQVDKTFPRLIVENESYYRDIGWIKDTMTRIRELEKLYADESLRLRGAMKRVEELANPVQLKN